MSISNIWGLK